MSPQQALEEAIEKMGVWVTKHPTGAILVTQGDEQMRIFPHATRWTYQIFEGRQALAKKSGFYTLKDVDLMAHEVLQWAWRNGAKYGLH